LRALIDSTQYPRLETGQIQIVVVADSCEDDTARIARQVVGGRGVVIEAQLGTVGEARRIGTDQALRAFAGRPPSSVWLANTDADTIVPVDWLQRQLDLATAGYEGVAGTIRLDACLYQGRDLATKLMADYFVAPDGSHPHVHGANLGMRADAYLAAGGWSDAALAEDHCLWKRLRRSGARLISSAAVSVLTSSRLHGRAIGGFACTLRDKVEPASAAIA
jgi:cellulose synthase/poly-beta-1,6-N-acetylglucosamine synthase-like glycosyltransferase